MYHPAAWSTRPVFLSSPFLDFHAERDCLRDVVFPELQDLLRGAKRRLHLALVDLRMGVETGSLADEEQKDCFILKVCLEEVDRCRPFFIVLLGDRYGSIMPKAQLEAAAGEVGLQAPVEGMSLTALEIEYGIFHMPQEQKQRTWVYIRDPLPYARMPAELREIYEDDDPQRTARLDELITGKGWI